MHLLTRTPFAPSFSLFAQLSAVFVLAAGICLNPATLKAVTLQEAPPVEERQEEKQKEDKPQDEQPKTKKTDKDQKPADAKETAPPKDFKKGGAAGDPKSDGEKSDGNKEKETGDKKPAESQEDTATGEEPSERRSASRRRRQSRSTANSKAADAFLNIFRPVIADAARATVEIKTGDDTIALGAVVDPSGFVLTKQSELQRPLSCRLYDGRDVSAYVYGVHPETDLALLKVEAENLPVVPWANADSLDIGHWLATVKGDQRPLGVGVVGVNARLIKPQSGFMGVNLRQTERGVEIINVTEDSPAESGGLKRGDIVIKVNGESYTEIDKLIPRVKSFPPGEEIRLTILRDDREIVVDVVLGEEQSLNPLYERSNAQNTMGGNELSKRRQNFPLAVQHDTFLKPRECGGPVVNIDGQVVGINIARQGRVSSLMLPAALVQKVIDELKTGQWAPAVVYKDRIDEINRTLQDLNTQVALSPMNNDDLKKKVNQLTKDEKSLRQKLEKTLKDRIRAEVELEQASETMESATAEIERLKLEREKLVTGTK